VVIDKDGKKTTGLSEEMSLEEKNLIFIDAYKYKKEFDTLNKFFKLKIPQLNTSTHSDVHIYTGHESKCRSFGPHFDLADNIIVQAQGKSRWIVANCLDVILHPGDAIFIPNQVVHECIPLGRRLSLSFPFWYN